MKKLTLIALSVSLFLGAPWCLAQGDEHDRPRPSGERAAPPRQAPSRPGSPMRPTLPNRPMARPAFDGRGQVLDSRYNHGRYYPPLGTVRPALPDAYRPYYRGGDRFYFSGGVWYAPRGPGFVVVRPPVGLVIAVLPPYYSTVWYSGVPYYYADNVYYTWQPDANGYAVVDTPPGASEDADAQPDAAPPADNSTMDLIVYPKEGQSKEQQAADKFECHTWAKGQTGFDPTQPNGGGSAQDADVNRSNYNRAMSACLQARGYQVN